MTWRFARARHDADHRRAAICALLAAAEREMSAVAIDGPLRPDLEVRCSYRTCDALLSRGAFQRRGKVAPTNCPSGLRLHREASLLAGLALEHVVAPARHRAAIHPRAVVEAFPNLWLGVMCDDDDGCRYPRPARHRRWTDTLFPGLAERAKLEALMTLLLPGHRVAGSWSAVTHHEDRAALACAVSALGVALGRHVAVGAADGWVVLPPTEAWGRGLGGGAWAETALRRNIASVARDLPGRRPTVYRDDEVWMTA